MIGKAASISHTKASIQYGWNQEKDAEIVLKKNLAGDSPKEITEEFKIIQSMNVRCKKNTISFVLSPTVEDGKKLDVQGLNKIANEFIKDLKLENHQAIAFSHNDKDHKHLHLYINRIDFQGKAYNDSFIGKRSHKAAERVALKLGLQTVTQVREEKLEEVLEIRSEIKSIHDFTLQNLQIANFLYYIKAMKKKKVLVIPVKSKQGKLIGYRYEYKGINLKGSDVHRSMSVKKVEKEIQQNIKVNQSKQFKIRR
ncbi:relaxase/mobilization nuclease domain-containing protein [Polaribacter glomeratus]|uniref:MobA/VirD2-like nuclease domain-containing protein n=1 Tax=Polaribacter glomeratus TaxID=102 RepID=A0A2S7WYL5_9FLAO|nr:relaxase/mobilization nuclease domain-containing protein [Polaribacter glomeratus]PQJ82618.1 hypothetical protein BTO16_08530 [Polaribacter glomeratus]TXD64926.1 mobilization protein [Polaribacter glomeratus]